jgi:hypothetical protein
MATYITRTQTAERGKEIKKSDAVNQAGLRRRMLVVGSSFEAIQLELFSFDNFKFLNPISQLPYTYISYILYAWP